MLEFEILVRGHYRPEQLLISYQPTLTMPITPPTQSWMDDLWQHKLALAQTNRTLLFDAPLYRYIHAAPSSDNQLHLTLGDTSYKQYVTSREPAFSTQHPRPELANPLAVCSVVETSDAYILLDQRQGVDVYVGRYHVIGGFFERTLDANSNALPDPFAAIQREIREETGIQLADISSQHALAIVYDLATPHAEMCFLTQLSIPLHDVLHHRTPEENEIKQLHTLHITAQSLHQFILTHHGNISATGEPNLLLYGAWKFGEPWLNDLMAHLGPV